MKKLFCILGLCSQAFLFSACSTDNSTESNVKQIQQEIISAEEFSAVYANPEQYKDREVEFYGKVFLEPERDDKGTYLQIFTQSQGSDGNTLVAIKDPNLEVKVGDIVYVNGIVGDVFEGTNLFGVTMTAPTIVATSVEQTTYDLAFSPSLKTIEVNQEIEQNGYSMILERVEMAEDETRAYLKITNNSSETINFYSFNSVITQGINQIEQSDNWNADYPEITSNILPGIVSEGIVTFEAADINGDNLNLIFKGSSDNYRLDFEPFVFECPLN